MLDAWAHNNVPGLETFFTPWHAVFYSGFPPPPAWVLWTCPAPAVRRRPGPARAIPVGYGLDRRSRSSCSPWPASAI